MLSQDTLQAEPHQQAIADSVADGYRTWERRDGAKACQLEFVGLYRRQGSASTKGGPHRRDIPLKGPSSAIRIGWPAATGLPARSVRSRTSQNGIAADPRAICQPPAACGPSRPGRRHRGRRGFRQIPLTTMRGEPQHARSSYARGRRAGSAGTAVPIKLTQRGRTGWWGQLSIARIDGGHVDVALAPNVTVTDEVRKDVR